MDHCEIHKYNICVSAADDWWAGVRSAGDWWAGVRSAGDWSVSLTIILYTVIGDRRVTPSHTHCESVVEHLKISNICRALALFTTLLLQ